MDKKLLFFDIDGTLSMPGKTVRQSTIDALKRAQENGHLIFISTGRRFGDAPKDVLEIGFDGFVYSAGAKIILNDEVILDEPLTPELQKRIMDTLDELGIYYTMEASDFNYASSDENPFENVEFTEGLSSELQRALEQANKDFPASKPFSEYNGQPVYKICYRITDVSLIPKMHERLDDIAKVVDFYNLFGDSPMLVGEISDYNVSKGTAIDKLCEILNVDVEDTVAFGDSMNDAEMIVAAGRGVAMGNSEEGLIKLSDAVCEDVYDDGVVKELERLKVI